MTLPGELYDTGVATIGGRGQQATLPYPHALHTLTLTRETISTHPDHFTTADEAIEARVRRLRENRTPYTRDGMTIQYTDYGGAKVTLTYTKGSES